MNCARRLWATLHEPRVVTAILVGFYLGCVVAGLGMVTIAVSDRKSWLGDELSLTIGGLLAGSGLVGVPAAWVGAWWLERAVTVAVGGAGLAGTVGIAAAMTTNPTLVDKPMAWFGCVGGIGLVQVAVNRWVRIGLDPYAPGRGPALPTRRIETALQRAEQDLQEAVSASTGPTHP